MDLSECRMKLDQIDQKIVQLLEERMEISEAVAAYKAAHGLPVLDEAREAEKLRTVASLTKEEKNKTAVTELFIKIMEESRKRQETII